MSVDPLSATFPWNSPYSFAENIPIAGIDLDGKEFDLVINSPVKTGTTQQIANEIGIESAIAYATYWHIVGEWPDPEDHKWLNQASKWYVSLNGNTSSNFFIPDDVVELIPNGTENQINIYGLEWVNHPKDGGDVLEEVRIGTYIGTSDPLPMVKETHRSFDIEGGITYGHAAGSVKIGKGLGFNFQLGNYLLGGRYNSRHGGEKFIGETDELTYTAALDYAIGGIGYGGTLGEKGEFSAGYSPSTGFANTGIGGSKSFKGIEVNLAIGVGIRFKIGMLKEVTEREATPEEVTKNP